MKTICSVCFFLYFCVTFNLSAQVTVHSRTSSPSISFSCPVNNTYLDLPSNLQTLHVSILVDYFPKDTTAMRKIEFFDGTNTYTNYYSSAFNQSFPYLIPIIPDYEILSAGTYTWSVTAFYKSNSNYIYESSETIAFTVQPSLTILNNFGGGTVVVNSRQKNSGYSFNPTTTVNMTAENNQFYDNYVRSFVNWTSDYSGGSSGNNLSSTAAPPTENHGTCTANFRKILDINLANSYGGGTMYFNNSTISTPYSDHVYGQNPATLSVESSVNTNNFIYGFVNWSDGNTSSSRSWSNLDEHLGLTANYSVVKPSNSYKNMAYPGTAGDYITVSWSEHPDSNVTEYEIWRRVRHNGVTGADVCIATVSRGTTSYTDYDYTYTASYTDDLLWYDVRAYYSPNGSYADAEFVAVYGKMDVSKQSDDKAATKTTENLSVAPTEYSLGSYPNPFNPTTVIRYTMPEAGQVSLKVYNILSQEVANLVESNQSAGVHQVNFNASHLPTGIYIARLQAGAKIMTTKLQLVK